MLALFCASICDANMSVVVVSVVSVVLYIGLA